MGNIVWSDQILLNDDDSGIKFQRPSNQHEYILSHKCQLSLTETFLKDSKTP